MKLSLKFGLFVVLILLIHCTSNWAMEDTCKVPSPTYPQEKCYVSQDDCPIQNALERLYILYSTQSCDMSHTEGVHVPAEKSIMLLITYFCENDQSQNPSSSVSLHSPAHHCDSITYYIYRLRKIIV